MPARHLDEAPRAYEMLEEKTDGCVRAVIRPGDGWWSAGPGSCLPSAQVGTQPTVSTLSRRRPRMRQTHLLRLLDRLEQQPRRVIPM